MEFNGSFSAIQVLDGNRTWIDYWPWMSFYRGKIICNQSWKTTRCGATVVGKRWILVAGQCVDDYIDKSVPTSANSSYVECGPGCACMAFTVGSNGQHDEYAIKQLRIHLHPNYSVDTDGVGYVNDIALAEFETPLTYNDTVQQISLAKNFTEGTGNLATVVGWGEKSIPSYILCQGTVKMVPFNLCQNLSTHRGYPHDEAQVICSVPGPADIHPNGDTGGPLMVEKAGEPGSWLQVGIISWTENVPGADKKMKAEVPCEPPNSHQLLGFNHLQRPLSAYYTRVSTHCDWIEKTTAGEVKCV